MTSRYLLALLLLFCYVAPTQAQLDSLAKVLPNMPNDTNKIEVLKELSLNYMYSDNEKAVSYARQLSALAKELGDDHLERYGRYVEGSSLHYGGEDEKALEIIKQVIEDCRASGDQRLLAFNLNMLTFIHQSSYQTDLALEAVRECLKICLELDDKRMIAIAYHSTASTYEMIGEKETSKTYLEKAIPIFEELGDQRGIGVMYQSMASLSFGQQSIDLARKALEYLEGGFDRQAIGMCHWTIGGGYYELEDYAKALESYQKALEIFKEIGYAEGEGQMVGHIGMILARVGRYDEARPLLDRGHQLGQELGYNDIFLQTHMGNAFYYASKGNVSLTIAYIDSLNAIKDTIFNQEKAEQLLFTEAQLQTKEKEAEIARQESQLRKASYARTQILLSSIFVILGLLGILLLLRSRQRQKQKAAAVALSLEKDKATQLAELDQLKSNFFANISHEFRTPLTLILGPLDQMRKGIFTGDRERYFDLMHRNGQRLQGLIDQLLDLSKLESEKMQLQLEPGDIHQFLRQLTASLESWTVQKEIDYRLQIPETALWVDFDPDKLQKIVVNLLSNAIKFTSSGGQVFFRVQHTQSEHEINLILEVKDTGIGIPMELQNKIFERFYHIESDMDGMASSGIGLALVKELVHFQGGTITMESEEGVFTFFHVELPLAIAERKPQISISPLPLKIQPLPTASEQELVDAGGLTDKELVLLVEDNPDVRTYIIDILKDQYRIIEAQNGRLGLEKAEASIPDIIISDVMMPEMDGVQMIKHLKANLKTDHIPIIMLTAKAEQADKIESLDIGADDYLTKPFDAEELQARVINLIKVRKRLKEKYRSDLFLQPAVIKTLSQEEKFLLEVKKEIEKNLSNEWYGVEDLASSLGFSRSQLYRKLKSICDQSPNEMIRNFRLIRAKELLEQDKANISEIAYEVGFSSLSYFSKEFKKKWGTSPSEWNSAPP